MNFRVTMGGPGWPAGWLGWAGSRTFSRVYCSQIPGNPGLQEKIWKNFMGLDGARLKIWADPHTGTEIWNFGISLPSSTMKPKQKLQGTGKDWDF